MKKLSRTKHKFLFVATLMVIIILGVFIYAGTFIEYRVNTNLFWTWDSQYYFPIFGESITWPVANEDRAAISKLCNSLMLEKKIVRTKHPALGVPDDSRQIFLTRGNTRYVLMLDRCNKRVLVKKQNLRLGMSENYLTQWQGEYSCDGMVLNDLLERMEQYLK